MIHFIFAIWMGTAPAYAQAPAAEIDRVKAMTRQDQDQVDAAYAEWKRAPKGSSAKAAARRRLKVAKLQLKNDRIKLRALRKTGRKQKRSGGGIVDSTGPSSE